MLRKFSIKELRPGMFVLDASPQLADTPFLYTTEGMLDSMDDIGRIAAQGYREAIVDLNRSYKEWTALYAAEAELSLTELGQKPSPAPVPFTPAASTAEEFPKAARIYDEALDNTRRIMRQFRDGGALDVRAGSIIVEGIMDSVLRNTDALQAVSKLRTQDDYTFSHCVNVALLSVMFIRHLGGNESDMLEAGMAGFLHDIGNIRTPPEILNAPRSLTAEEFSAVRRHPQIGHDYLAGIPEIPKNVPLTALEHHERINGSGYPNGKTGPQISRLGKITAILDVYDAISSRRTYKNPIMPHRVLGMLYNMRGQDFDPMLTEQFIHCIGIYPAGSVVKLNTGEMGIVVQINHAAPLHPTVLIVRDPQGRHIGAVSRDLSRTPDIKISECMETGAHGIQPANILREHARAV